MKELVVKVKGPIKIPCHVGKGGRTISDDNIRDFWRSYKKYEDRRGCYVFGIRAGKGCTPGYAGKATKGLKKEIFAHHKLTRYQQFIVEYGRGTPVFFFLLAPVNKGKPNSSQIGEIERYLINMASAANANLLNVRDAKVPRWGIKGVVRGGKGRSSQGTKVFRTMMGIK